MLKGILPRRLRIGDILETRLFPSRIRLGSRWADYYRRWVTTSVLHSNRRHTLRYAF